MAVPVLKPETETFYPESDGEPIADNTKQFQWIMTIQGGLDALFADDPNVFVAGDLLWYPVEGDPSVRMAPDVLVAFDRPKGHRGSYIQAREGGIPPAVVFEVLSPSNTVREMHNKRAFYERHGVEEYYLYDPEGEVLAGWLRSGNRLDPIARMVGWTSPLLGVTFGLESNDLVLTRPDGRRFQNYVEVEGARKQAELLADKERQRAEQERQRAEQERQAREQAEARVERLAARLRELGLSEDELR